MTAIPSLIGSGSYPMSPSIDSRVFSWYSVVSPESIGSAGLE